MKVKVLETGEVYKAKRFKNFTKEEIQNETRMPEIWDENDIFIEKANGCCSFLYMYDDEIGIIEEEI